MAENPEDLNLPTAVVKRIVSDAVPPTCKVSKEANAAIAKAASVFVLYATSCANNVAQKSHRKTLTGADVIKAIHEMEFDKFVKPLEASLESWKVIYSGHPKSLTRLRTCIGCDFVRFFVFVDLMSLSLWSIFRFCAINL